MKYRVICKNLGIVGRIGCAQRGDVLDESAIPADEIEKLLDMSAIAPVPAEEPAEGEKTLDEMTRKELDAVAAGMGIDGAGLSNKGAVLAAIREAMTAGDADAETHE